MTRDTLDRALPERRPESGLAIQARVVFALMHRDMLSRFGRTMLGYPWAVVAPLLTIATMSLLFTFMQRRAPIGESFLLFFATGYIPYMVFRMTSLRGFGAFLSNAAVFQFPIVMPFDALLSRILLEFWTMIIASVIVFLVIWLLGFGGLPVQVTPMLYAVGLLALLGFGVATLNACIEIYFVTWGRFYRVMMMLLFYTSGIFYIPDWLPYQVRDMVVWNPILHVVELFRTAFYPGYGSETFDARYLLSWAFGVVPVSMALERVVRRSRQQ